MAQFGRVAKIRRSTGGVYFYTYENQIGSGVPEVSNVDIGNTALQAWNEIRDLIIADIPLLGQVMSAQIVIQFGDPST